MPVNIRGKQYTQVKERVNDFRSQFKFDYSIVTTPVSLDDPVIFHAEVINSDGRIIGNGYAEEFRNSTNINKTSCVENCETSAIGRALASCGFGGDEYATANEVTDAIINQKVKEALEKKQHKAISEVEQFEQKMRNAKTLEELAGIWNQINAIVKKRPADKTYLEIVKNEMKAKLEKIAA